MEFNFEEITGVIQGDCKYYYWNCTSSNNNDWPFVKLKISDKFDFCKKIIGYTPNDGQFPECRSKEDVHKILIVLKSQIEKLPKIAEPSLKSEIFIPDKFKVGDWIKITYSDKNFNDEMESMVGNTYQITSLCTESGNSVEFDGDKGWCWNYNEGHFIKLKEPIIKEPITKKLEKVTIEKVNNYKDGDKFQIGKQIGLLKYSITYNWWWDGSYYLNEATKYDLQKKVLGYTSKNGGFPFCKTLEDLITFCSYLNETNWDKEHTSSILPKSVKTELEIPSFINETPMLINVPRI